MRLKKLKEPKSCLKTFRLKLTEKHEIQQKANIYTDGNVSEWLIYAALNHIPRKKDLER